VTGLLGGDYRGSLGLTPSARLPERPPSVHVAGRLRVEALTPS